MLYELHPLFSLSVLQIRLDILFQRLKDQYLKPQPFYHQEYEDEYKYKDIEFECGHLVTKEIVYVRPDSEQQKLGREFIEFMVRDDIQKIIAQMNIMYPAIENVNNIPDKMRKLKKPKEIQYDDFLEADPLIKTWLEVASS